MDVKQISQDGLLRKYLITVSPDETKAALDEEARGLINQVSLPGFRPGKVPLSMIKSRFQDNLRIDLIEKFAQAGMNKALESDEKDTIVMGAPLVSSQNFSEEDGITIELEYEVFPKIPPVDLATIQLKKYTTDCSEEVLAKEISMLQTAHSRVKTLDGIPVSTGNIVLCDWEILSADSTKLKEGTDYVEVSDLPALGIAGFGKHLIGANVGETKEFEVLLPDDHFINDHAGQKVKFIAKIKNVFDKVIPSVEDLTELFGFGSVETFKQTLRQVVEVRINVWSKEILKHDLMENIRPLLVGMDLPQRALSETTKSMELQLADNSKDEADVTQAQKTDAKTDDEAKQSLKASIFLGHFARTKNIDATEAEVDNYIKLQPQLSKIRSSKELTKEQAESIRNKIVTTKVLDSLLSKTQVQESNIPFDEFYKLYQKSFY